MVVEDESIVRIGLRYMIHWEKYGVHWKAEASNGEEALNLMASEDIHIVFTDIHMPGMDGLEFAKQVKMHHAGVQVVMLSSYDNFSYVKEALRIGASDYLHKPTMDEQEIVGTLYKAIAALEANRAVQLNETDEEKNSRLLVLLDKYTFPKNIRYAEFETDAYRAGYWLTLFRKREDAAQCSGENGHLRFMSIRYLIEESIKKHWGGVVFHRNEREIIWIAPLIPQDAALTDANSYMESIRQKVLELLNTVMIYSSSSTYQHINQLPSAYMEALLNLPVHDHTDKYIIRQAKEFVDQNYLQEISLGKTADALHISSGYLSRLFMQEIGENFSDYVIRNRIEYSQKLLRETNRKIYEIASSIGYLNPHYFSKIFKERVGLTPLEYRNQ